MIPKTIHYCWISGDKKPDLIRRCMDTWQKVMPDYQVKCWDKSSIQECNIPFVQEAISVGQYPAAADYIRLYALYYEGGIYLDSDIEVLRPFDSFLSNRFFCGTEAAHINDDFSFNMEAAIMGSEPGHPFVRECMKYFENHHFIHEDGTYDNRYAVMPWIISGIAHNLYSYKYMNEEQDLGDGVKVYSTNEFCNNLCLDEYITDNTYAIHRNAASWKTMEHRGWLFHFCREHNLMELYHRIEKNRKRRQKRQ